MPPIPLPSISNTLFLWVFGIRGVHEYEGLQPVLTNNVADGIRSIIIHFGARAQIARWSTGQHGKISLKPRIKKCLCLLFPDPPDLPSHQVGPLDLVVPKQKAHLNAVGRWLFLLLLNRATCYTPQLQFYFTPSF